MGVLTTAAWGSAAFGVPGAIASARSAAGVAAAVGDAAVATAAGGVGAVGVLGWLGSAGDAVADADVGRPRDSVRNCI